MISNELCIWMMAGCGEYKSWLGNRFTLSSAGEAAANCIVK